MVTKLSKLSAPDAKTSEEELERERERWLKARRANDCARKARRRERAAALRIILPVEVNGLDAAHALATAGPVPRNCDDRRKLAAGLSRLAEIWFRWITGHT